jgi:hypothetical protein
MRWFVYSTYLLVLAIAGIELFWWLKFDSVSWDKVNEADAVWKNYYRELWRSGAVHAESSPQDQIIDILLLGGSVLEQTGDLWEAEVTRQTGRKARVFNVAVSAHTSRDSRIKYSRLASRKFDWVVVYHGINDVRMNYTTDADFRDDYTHCDWYHGFERCRKLGRLKVIDVTDSVVTALMTRDGPSPDLYPLGRTLRTPVPFGENLAAIATQATSANAKVVLMTFAWHLPADYTAAAFASGQLDYGEGTFSMLAEDWGEPSQIPGVLRAQNEQIRRVVTEHSTGGSIVLVDQAELMQRGSANFSDICHLTPDGCQRFVQHAVRAAAQQFGELNPM